jgi:hypothetical protein
MREGGERGRSTKKEKENEKGVFEKRKETMPEGQSNLGHWRKNI